MDWSHNLCWSQIELYLNSITYFWWTRIIFYFIYYFIDTKKNTYLYIDIREEQTQIGASAMPCSILRNTNEVWIFTFKYNSDRFNMKFVRKIRILFFKIYNIIMIIRTTVVDFVSLLICKNNILTLIDM